MDKRKAAEGVKTAVIVLLLISLVFLAWKSGLFSGGIWRRGASSGAAQYGESGDVSDGGEISAEAARPMAIVVTSPDGEHFGEKYDRAELDRLYERTGRLFAEAMGSAGEPDVIASDGWRAALSSPGVCFVYMSPVKLSVLDGWLGTEIIGLWREMSSQRVCLYVEDGAVRFAFTDAETGLSYSSLTGVPAEAVTAQTDGAVPNGAAYLFETDAKDPKEPDLLIFKDGISHPVLTTADPLSSAEITAAVLRRFGVDMEFGSHYTDSDGSQVFVESGFTVRVSGDGTLEYRLVEEPDGAPVSAALAVERVREIAQKTAGAYCGDARIEFCSVTAAADGSYDVEFCYTAAGGRIFTGSRGTAVTARVSAGEIEELRMYFRAYSEGGESVTLLPELQAAAAAGGGFVLGYADTGAAELAPEWFQS